jgi:hypothetical protein
MERNSNRNLVTVILIPNQHIYVIIKRKNGIIQASHALTNLAIATTLIGKFDDLLQTLYNKMKLEKGC